MGWTLDFLRERLLGWIQDQGGWVRPLTTPLLPEPTTVVSPQLPIFRSSDVVCNVFLHVSDQLLIHLVAADLFVTPDLMTPDLTNIFCSPWCIHFL